MIWSANHWKVCMYSLLKPCKTTAAIESIPEKRLSLDLDSCEEVLRERCTIVANAGILLIVHDLCEVSIHRDGRLILKTDAMDLATCQTSRIAGWLEGSRGVRDTRHGNKK